MSKARWMRVLALLLGLALVAAACGDSDSDDATSDETETTEAAPTGDDEGPDTSQAGDDEMMEEHEAPELLLGTLLPETGPLAVLGAGMVPAAQMAVDDMNAAGAKITLLTGDSATDPDIANATVDGHLAAGVQGIIGAASSGTSSSVIDKVTGAQVAQCSPSNTAAGLGTSGDDGFYFRTAPSDDLQAPTLANIVLDDGFANVAIVARADEYGVGFSDFFIPAFEDGGGTVVYSEPFAPEAESFDDVVADVVAAGPDAVVLIAFEEGIQILIDMVAAGVGPADVQIYITDGMAIENLGELIDADNPGIAAGIKGTQPSAAPASGAAFFPEAFAAAAGEDTPAIFAAHSYDCTIIFGLAALQANSGVAADWAPLVADVTRGGTVCNTYADCAELIAAGEDIDYNGAAGPLDFLDVGEPGTATYDIYEYDADGVQSVLEQIDF
jgi:ABC-type branched-subunit amino acid transport system substrate-binding protein